jgi:hypothetical protein
VHKKYTRVKGKVYGPYLYENKRVNGKVVTSYLGKVKSKAKVLPILIIFIILSLNISFTSFASAGILEKSGILITGNVVEGSTDVTNIPVGQIDYGQIMFYLVIGIIVLATLVSSILLYRFIKRKMLERRYEQIRPTFNWQQ